MIRSALASASIFLLSVGFAGNAAATNIYFQYGSPLKTCQVKVGPGVDIVADTIGGTFVVAGAFANPPPNGKTEAGDLYISSATPDATTCGTTQTGPGIPATPTITLGVPVTTLPANQTTTPINISIGNLSPAGVSTSCVASATLNTGSGAFSTTVSGWSGTVCSNAAACGSLTSATASNLSTGTYVFGLTCSSTLTSGNLTSTATSSLAVSPAVTANIIVPTGNCPSPVVYSGSFTQQPVITNDSTGVTGSTFGSIFGGPSQVGWPGVTSAGPQFIVINTNGFLAFSFTALAGTHSGTYLSQASANQANASITISTCKGDFRTAVVAGALGANCFKSSTDRTPAVSWDTDPNGTTPGTCHLTPGTQYWLNIANVALTNPPTHPVQLCSNAIDGAGCDSAIKNTVNTP
ncbi:hypothetical protein ELE36_16310 [Pseudolysobacter antarcticus]|uniref:Ig-like domain-containing protein n=1 Tax=Pseudolysobacter antarcticus TaxID=2511995 RepID=A0A411HMT0_9GAMM|nr:hypothetical protein [Pseudolysobacter antarcticus]QBB71791.1 hypothetical protein ELE36_16310 [Pseudolysobacter antarcticus]